MSIGDGPMPTLEERITELEKKFDEEIEIRKARWQFLKNTVNSALLPYIVPINKKLGYNPKTTKFERIEKLERILLLDKEVAEETCAENIIELIISQSDSNKDKLEELEKKQLHDYNKLLWIKMIPYKEWFWNLKMSMEKEIKELKEKQIHWATLENVTVCRLGIESLEEALRWLMLMVKDYPSFVKNDNWHIQFNKQLEKLDGDSEVLRKIKKLAQEESDFYNKHGYFSFWSDKLKEQRKKEKDVAEASHTELFELYLKDKEQYYFKKTSFPFTELNNMVNLGIGEMKTERADLEWLIMANEKREWHDGNKHTRIKLQKIKKKYMRGKE